MNLLTRMKSPTSSVGRIDDDGILNGSARNERSRNTISSTGKNDLRVLDPRPARRRVRRRAGAAEHASRSSSQMHAGHDRQQEQDQREVHR